MAFRQTPLWDKRDLRSSYLCNWVVEGTKDLLNSGSLAVLRFESMTFWLVGQHLNHWVTTAAVMYCSTLSCAHQRSALSGLWHHGTTVLGTCRSLNEGSLGLDQRFEFYSMLQLTQLIKSVEGFTACIWVFLRFLGYVQYFSCTFLFCWDPKHKTLQYVFISGLKSW